MKFVSVDCKAEVNSKVAKTRSVCLESWTVKDRRKVICCDGKVGDWQRRGDGSRRKGFRHLPGYLNRRQGKAEELASLSSSDHSASSIAMSQNHLHFNSTSSSSRLHTHTQLIIDTVKQSLLQLLNHSQLLPEQISFTTPDSTLAWHKQKFSASTLPT